MKKRSTAKHVGKVATDADYSFAVNLMQFLVVPTFVLDGQGNVLIWNKACERLTGIPAEEVLGTKEHWRGFYDSPRPCLADLIVQNRTVEIEALYAAHDDISNQSHGIHAENWCVMPRLDTQLYLAIDVGPIFGVHGELIAVIETLRDMTSLKQAQTRLELLATHDGLTGIANRRGFDEKLHVECSRARREKLPLALLMVDVDHFKRFNDTHGHQSGDECLKRIATVLSEAVHRPTDLVARYGGEEFAVILPSIDEKGAVGVANKILESVAKMDLPFAIGQRGLESPGGVTVSIGVAAINAAQGSNQEDLVKRADRALYRAKHAGRNRVEVSPTPEVTAS